MRMLTCGRQRGANWRNDGPGGPPGPAAAAGRIGTGDAVDREYEVSRPPFFDGTKTNLT
jgi:splicing factor 1